MSQEKSVQEPSAQIDRSACSSTAVHHEAFTKGPWWNRLLANVTRMATDEEYRKEVATRLF